MVSYHTSLRFRNVSFFLSSITVRDFIDIFMRKRSHLYDSLMPSGNKKVYMQLDIVSEDCLL